MLHEKEMDPCKEKEELMLGEERVREIFGKAFARYYTPDLQKMFGTLCTDGIEGSYSSFVSRSVECLQVSHISFYYHSDGYDLPFEMRFSFPERGACVSFAFALSNLEGA